MTELPPDAKPATSHDAFLLGAVRIDPVAGDLTGPGAREQLDPKVMDVLQVLHAHAGQLVTRETLFAQVWPDRIVTDDVLSRCIYQLRRQLASAAGPGTRDWIETLPKRGYRLRTEEMPSPAPDPIPPGATDAVSRPVAAPVGGAWGARMLAIAALGALVVVAILASTPARERGAATPRSAATEAAPANSIAVLPFADLSETRDRAYLAEGFADELLSTLSERSALVVTARTSSFAFRERGTDLVEVGRRLRVAYVVEGSVREFGKRLRITTDLVDARTGRRVWSRSYDRDLGDVLALQDEIAESVARSLEAKLTTQSSSPQSGVPEANDAYLRGRFLFNRRGPGDIAAAEKQLRRAVALDPAYGHAWTSLVGVYTVEPERDPTLALRREAVERALAAAPDLAETHVRAASYYFAAGDVDRARRHNARAAEIDPDNLLLLSVTAGTAFWQGRFAEAVALQRRVVERDPLSAVAHNNLGGYLTSAGDHAAARAAYATHVELNPWHSTEIREVLVQLSILEGRIEQAWQDTLALPPGRDRDAALAMLAPARGDAEAAAAALARLTAPATASPIDLMRAAEVHAYLDDPDSAWAMLERALDASGPSWAERRWQVEARGSPFLAPLRSDPRWPGYLKRLEQMGRPI